ncbi:hypothetical protein [Rhizobium mongolense]
MIGNVWEWCVERVAEQSSSIVIGYSGYATVSGQPGHLPAERVSLKGGGFYDDIHKIPLTIRADEIFGGSGSLHADIGFRTLSTIALEKLPAEIRNALLACPPLSSRQARVVPATGK